MTNDDVDIEWEIMDALDFFSPDRDELSNVEMARLVRDRLRDEDGIRVTLSQVLDVINEQ